MSSCTEKYLSAVAAYDEQEYVRVYHDESIYHSNEDQRTCWTDGSFQPLKPKSQGSPITISDFIVEVDSNWGPQRKINIGRRVQPKFRETTIKAMEIFDMKYAG